MRRHLLILLTGLMYTTVFSQDYYKRHKIFTLLDTGFVKEFRYTTRQISFDNHCIYLPQSKPTLDSIFIFLEKNKNLTVEIGVHVDKVDPKSSEPVTFKSARNICDTLVKMGIDKNRLTFKGYGSTQRLVTEVIVRPVAKDKHEAKMMYELNNRVEIKITSTNYGQ